MVCVCVRGGGKYRAPAPPPPPRRRLLPPPLHPAGPLARSGAHPTCSSRFSWKDSISTLVRPRAPAKKGRWCECARALPRSPGSLASQIGSQQRRERDGGEAPGAPASLLGAGNITQRTSQPSHLAPHPPHVPPPPPGARGGPQPPFPPSPQPCTGRPPSGRPGSHGTPLACWPSPPTTRRLRVLWRPRWRTERCRARCGASACPRRGTWSGQGLGAVPPARAGGGRERALAPTSPPPPAPARHPGCWLHH